jgi:D-alanyl-D-alanine carboxypeptidase
MTSRPRVGCGAIAQKLFLFGAALLAVTLAFSSPVAAHPHYEHHWHPDHPLYRYTYPSEDAALIVDGETGHVLYSRHAEELRYPASLTKLMVLYLLFDALKKGTVTLQTPMPVSAHAAGQAPVKLYLRPGIDTVTVEQAIKAIIVLSANDIAVVVAEELGGTETRFARMMTAEAHKLGMTHTHYADASGLPNRGQLTTAGDLAILARKISYKFPQYFHFFTTHSFTWRGHTYYSFDHLIGSYPGADGMKTGFTDWSGFNLVTSVTRGNVHLIGVVMGGRTAHLRDIEMEKLLNEQFARIKRNPTLVAHMTPPWKAYESAPQTMIAGFELPIPQATPAPRPHVAGAPSLRTAIAAPSPRPEVRLANYRRVQVEADVVPEGKRVSTPSVRSNRRDWTVQIGAYDSPIIARRELAAYARKSGDILGRAQRIVDSFKETDGRTMFRARFGLFAERQARRVCERLTERGQSCFTAIATR